MRAAEAVDDVEFFVRQLFDREVFENLPRLDGAFFVVVFVFVGRPPNLAGRAFLRRLVINDEFILWRASGEFAGHDIDRAEFGFDAFVKAFEPGFRFFIEENFIRRIVKNFGRAGNAVFRQIDLCHTFISFIV